MTNPIQFKLDGESIEVMTDPMRPLRDVLRWEFGKTCVKSGCSSGKCGVCTVLLDGNAVKSCLVFTGKADGKSITTIEGLPDATDGERTAIQDAFVEQSAVQCGYCTPGFLLTATAFLNEDDRSSDRRAVQKALKGNLCRCTGYEKIVEAVQSVADDDREDDSADQHETSRQ